MKVVVHNMKYVGQKRYSHLKMIHYQDQYYQEFIKVHQESFKKMSDYLQSKEDTIFYSREYQLQEKEYTFLLIIHQELIGSIYIKDNDIERLFVSVKHQKQGYGKQLLNFGIAYLQDKGINDITLSVADFNKGALQLYLDNDFIVDSTEICDW